MLNSKKSILIYGFNKEEIQLIKNNFIECKVINKNMVKMKMKDIIEGLKIETINKKLPEQKTVLFNNFNDKELSKIIDLIRDMFKQQPIFAVITQNSIEWTFEELLKHLIQEREWYRNH